MRFLQNLPIGRALRRVIHRMRAGKATIVEAIPAINDSVASLPLPTGERNALKDASDWSSEHQHRLATDPLYFAFVAMQSSGTKHLNERSAARDFYYFGNIAYSAISDGMNMRRLIAMSELTRNPLAPFADQRSNHLLAAFRRISVRGCLHPSPQLVVEALEELELLDEVGGKVFVETASDLGRKDQSQGSL